ncbi:amino acid ABC transporter ATP-binding/permease protein [Saccharomonospora piscinae]|uniref:amino acid ABC transporter ATP-binding/permease protein n=1 Tax=Saccharomonospora piscinae TaxID=687388 RepID=UPI0004632905|nr:ABC transporter ATP-binding protein [Saccharomonospora piscinae]
MNSSPARAFGALLPALRPERRGMVRSYLVGTASALALTGLSVVSAWAVGHAVIDRTLPGPVLWIVLIGLTVVRTVLTWHEMDVSHALAYRVLARLRMALFDAYARSVPGRRREHSGRAASVAMGDIERLEFFYAHTVAQLGTSATVLLTSVITALVLLPEAGLVLLVGSLLVAGSAWYRARAIRHLGEDEQHERSALSARIVDALGALREVLAYNLASRVIDDAGHTTARATTITRRRELLTQQANAVREFLVTAVVIGVIATSGIAAGVLSDTEQARLSPAVLPALVVIALAGVSAATDATTTLTQLHPLIASAQRVATGLHRAPVVTAPTAPRPLPDGPLGLRFADVSFSYEDRPPTLNGWSTEIAAGEHVGVAGPSGSGKSTIIALAARLRDPDSGGIELVGDDGTGIPLTELDDVSLRAAVALVDQEATLFHGTVRDNLVRGSGPRRDDELTAILNRVGALSWAGLDDELGQGGLRLSGGQQARLCLARALAREPRILLVDEVTASLDPETEHAISDVIADYDGTVLVASHRADTLARLHRVITISSGGIRPATTAATL